MKRDMYWDSLKFILIFLVVCGHCVVIYAPSGGINRALHNFIYTFHMPLFIFVSGMFSHIKDRNKYKMGILRIVETYIVFQLILAVPPMLLNCNITLKSIVSVIGVPRDVLWYLLSLAIWRFVVYSLPERIISKYPIRMMIICILISLFGGFIPVGNEFSLQRTMCFLPFFFMGYYAKNIELKKYIAQIPSILAYAILLSFFLFCFFILNKQIGFVLWGNRSYWSIVEYSPFLLCFARGLFIFSAITIGVMIMRLVPTRPYLSRWGKITLFIYIYHQFGVFALRLFIKHGYFPQIEWILILVSIILTMGLILLSHIKFFNILLTPVSYILTKTEKGNSHTAP